MAICFAKTQSRRSYGWVHAHPSSQKKTWQLYEHALPLLFQHMKDSTKYFAIYLALSHSINNLVQPPFIKHEPTTESTCHLLPVCLRELKTQLYSPNSLCTLGRSKVMVLVPLLKGRDPCIGVWGRLRGFSRTIISLAWCEIPTNKAHSPGAINKHVSIQFLCFSVFLKVDCKLLKSCREGIH